MGNSSSGLPKHQHSKSAHPPGSPVPCSLIVAEAPTFKIGTINIGDRQRGRVKAASVIDCNPTKESILIAATKLYSDEFQSKLKNVINPYGEGGAAKIIKEIIREKDLSGILKKKFYDIEVS